MDASGDPIWYPFTQMRAFEEENAPVIVRGEGAYLFDAHGKKYLDGVASLWCNLHGHRHPRLDAALAAQAGRVAHSTLLGLKSEAPLALARELVRIAPPGLARVFYTDSGATAVEAALKIAFQYHRVKDRPEPKRTRFVAFRNSYHGDTIGAVSVSGIEMFHERFRPLLFEADFAAIEAGATGLREILARRGDEIAAVILEPAVQGAAGMLLQPPRFVRDVAEAARGAGAIFIADEVATGFGRTGRMFACEEESVSPDLMCLGKGITAGYLPLASTLATERIYEAFLGEWSEFKHFFHGHTYTGNALASAVGFESLRIFEEERTLERVARLSSAATDALERLREDPRARDHIGEIRQKGLMIGIDLVSGGQERFGHRVILAARERGVILRPLGDTLVWMPPYCVTEEEIDLLGETTAVSIAAAGGDGVGARRPSSRSARRYSA